MVKSRKQKGLKLEGEDGSKKKIKVEVLKPKRFWQYKSVAIFIVLLMLIGFTWLVVKMIESIFPA